LQGERCHTLFSGTCADSYWHLTTLPLSLLYAALLAFGTAAILDKWRTLVSQQAAKMLLADLGSRYARRLRLIHALLPALAHFRRCRACTGPPYTDAGNGVPQSLHTCRGANSYDGSDTCTLLSLTYPRAALRPSLSSLCCPQPRGHHVALGAPWARSYLQWGSQSDVRQHSKLRGDVQEP
jgi:hypothetical protein